jgi:hypothetical protein
LKVGAVYLKAEIRCSDHVESPVMLFLTTTAIDLDEELKNRCLVHVSEKQSFD